MPKEIGLTEFRVLLGEFDRVIQVVDRESRHVHTILGGLYDNLKSVSDLWQSPGSATFEPLHRELRRHAEELDDVLAEIARRMHLTYENYVAAERKAQQNLRRGAQ